ncbi:MAG: TolC family protein [Endomicrobiia bacterium]|nr:TolC family protein [Endomicrobiaceae bacterium]MDD3053003.1 TolC family protein [Endomicrobiaceae bacterium]MDD3922929.1 TolC family protein [Endomicrobiaceae bacterium]
MRKIYLLITLMFFTNLLFAQDTKILTWQQCIDMANKYNQDLIVAKNNLAIAEYDYYISWNNYYPSADLKYGFNRKGSDVTEDNWDLSLNASQTLYNFKDISELKSKKAGIDKTVAQLTQSCAEVYYSIKDAFLQMCYAQENITLLENIYTLRTQSSDIVRLQYEGGKESKGNMLRAQAQKHSAYTDVLNAKRDLNLARRTLAQVLGVDINQDFTVNGELTLIEDKTEFDIDSKALEVPDVIISASNVKIAEYKVSYSKGDLYPNLSASASVGLSDAQGPIPPSDSKSWSLGVSLNYPLFSGGITSVKNTINSSKAALEQSQQEYKKTILTTKTSLQDVQMTIERTKDNVTTYQMFLEASIQRQKEANIKYLAGTMEFQTWQDIEQELVNNQISHLSALHNYNIALAKRDKMLGNTNGEIK